MEQNQSNYYVFQLASNDKYARVISFQVEAIQGKLEYFISNTKQYPNSSDSTRARFKSGLEKPFYVSVEGVTEAVYTILPVVLR